MVDQLANEIWRRIFELSDYKTRVRCRAVCSRFYKILRNTEKAWPVALDTILHVRTSLTSFDSPSYIATHSKTCTSETNKNMQNVIEVYVFGIQTESRIDSELECCLKNLIGTKT